MYFTKDQIQQAMHESNNDMKLIISLQNQIQDLRKNAREYARKDLIAELRQEISKRYDNTESCEDVDCYDCTERKGYNRAIAEIESLLANKEPK